MFLLSKKTIGLDISDDSVKVVEVSRRRGFLFLEKKASLALDCGVVKNGRILKKKDLALKLKEVFKKSDIRLLPGRDLYFAFPESQVYIRFIDIANGGLNKNKLRETALEEASNSIPLESEDLILNYKVINGEKKNKRLLLLAVSQKAILEWQSFFDQIKLDINFFDVAGLALRRVLLDGLKEGVDNVMIADVGGEETALSIYKNNELYYSGFINFRSEKAETQKEEENGDSDKKNVGKNKRTKKPRESKDGAVYPILQSALDDMVKEINSVAAYFKNNNSEESVKAVVLTGSSMRLKTVEDYLKNKINLLVQSARMKRVKNNESLLDYALAIGAAVKGLERKWKKKDIVIRLIKKVKKIKNKTEIEDKKEIVELTKESMEYKLEHAQVKKKVRGQTVKLIVIILLGAVVFYMAFWYRSYSQHKREIDLEAMVEEMKAQQ